MIISHESKQKNMNLIIMCTFVRLNNIILYKEQENRLLTKEWGNKYSKMKSNTSTKQLQKRMYPPIKLKGVKKLKTELSPRGNKVWFSINYEDEMNKSKLLGIYS